ncbi:MAG: hypothetical protein Q4F40_00925 [Akkermansia sp.]|nr:hypothetical protein [Akkermansia sp.]
MKISHLLLCALLSIVPTLSADTLWVRGVNQTSGWYDINKTLVNVNDDELCFAAAATNLITWWQNQLPVTPAGVPQSNEAIWARYLAGSNKDAAGDVAAAVQWWLTGVYIPTNNTEYLRSSYGVGASSQLTAFEGYYYKDYIFPLAHAYASRYSNYDTALRNAYTDEFRAFMHFRAVSEDVSSNILCAIQKGMGVAVGLAADTANLAHAITLWGVDYSETEGITALWLTDSDDAQYEIHEDSGLFSVAVTEINGRLYLDEKSEGNWYVDSETSGVYVNHIYALNPAEARDWGLPVPEPATATLSLMALMGLAARRRR